MSKFAALSEYAVGKDYLLLPFTFAKLKAKEYVVTNLVGESFLIDRDDLENLVLHKSATNSKVFSKARAHHLVYIEGEKSPLELLALKYRTRKRHLKNFTTLHMMVVSLRCDHSCQYCQVSRQSEDVERFDMSIDTANKSLEHIFRTPSTSLKIEFQGGEPLLNFDVIEHVVQEAENKAKELGKDVQFVIATTMTLLEDYMLDFCKEHDIKLSTSLDGPEDLHNSNRPRPGKDSYQRFRASLDKARDVLGKQNVSALMTTTNKSLDRVEEIIDEYVSLGFSEIFLRPLSPYGFAKKTKAYDSYQIDEWLQFYKKGLNYIIQLNKKGHKIKEIYTTIILRKMLTFDDPLYVDLMSPAGIGISAVIFNYDGAVYASDESRMLAEMGIEKFKIGNVNNQYEDIFASDALIEAIDESMTVSSPMCYECAYEPYCGSDPVFHYGMYGDLVGRKPQSAFCKKNMGIFEHIFEIRKNQETKNLIENWV